MQLPLRLPTFRFTAALAGTGALLLGLAFSSQAAAQTTDAPRAFEVTVTAEVLEPGAPASVKATEVTVDENGLLAHGVVVTWTDAAAAELSDERFTHHVTAESGEGDLVLAGRGCGASWSEAQQEVIHPCTLDLRIVQIAPSGTHEYPARIYPAVGPLRLETGTYVVDQTVSWWRSATPETSQQFTIRMTYDVTEVAPSTGISVEASVVEPSATVEVEATEVINADGQPSHGVRVTWNGTAPAILDDARFTHHETSGTTPEGHLITTGRGCGASVDEATGEVQQFCTDDLQLINLAPGETHEYPVRIHPSLGGLLLRPGTYTVEETIGWRASETGPRQEFTVRLVYTVTAEQPGILTPEPAAQGLTLVTWSGGAITTLPEAVSYWTATEGDFIGYVPDAPAFVNARFLALFPNATMPAGTALVVVR